MPGFGGAEPPCFCLHETGDVGEAIAGEQLDGRDIKQGESAVFAPIPTADGGAGGGHQNLGGEGGVVDAHVERKALVGGKPRGAGAFEQHAVGGVGHKRQFGGTHLAHLQRIVAEIGVGGDGGAHVFKAGPFIQYNINEPGMTAAPRREW